MDSGKLQFAKKWVAEYLNGRDPAQLESLDQVEAICRRVLTDDDAAELGGWPKTMARVMLGDRDPDMHKITRPSVQRILGWHPLLHNGGYGRSGDMRGLTGPEFWAKIAEQRQVLLSPESIKNIQAAYDWIRNNLRHGCHVNRNRTSYGLKHVMEGDTRHYVSNGEFIVAMLLNSYKISTTQYNPQFNVMESDVKAIIKRNNNKVVS